MSEVTRTVWTVLIEHRHGTNVHACSSESDARATLASFAYDSWQELSDRSDDVTPLPPTDQDEAIAVYFDHAREWSHPEDYDVESHAVTFAD